MPLAYTKEVSGVLQPGDSDSGVTGGVSSTGLSALFAPGAQPIDAPRKHFTRSQLAASFAIRGGKPGRAPAVTDLESERAKKRTTKRKREGAATKAGRRFVTADASGGAGGGGLGTPRLIQGGLGLSVRSPWAPLGEYSAVEADDDLVDEMKRRKRERHREQESKIVLDQDTQRRLLVSALAPALARMRELQWQGWGNPFVTKITKGNCVELGVPTYFSIITEPMDLTRMTEKLQEDSYASIDEFERDARMIVGNAQKFNMEGDPVYTFAGQLQVLIDNLMPECRRRLEALEMTAKRQARIANKKAKHGK